MMNDRVVFWCDHQERTMSRICYFLSAVMVGAGFGASDPLFGQLFAYSGALLIGCMVAFKKSGV
jgi:hypothetical protein